MADESAGTGFAELDRALGGLYWGDNVVWVWEGGELSSQGHFYDAIARRREDFGKTGYIVASSDPAEVTARWPWIEVLRPRGGARIAGPGGLLEGRGRGRGPARPPRGGWDAVGAGAGRCGSRSRPGLVRGRGRGAPV